MQKKEGKIKKALIIVVIIIVIIELMILSYYYYLLLNSVKKYDKPVLGNDETGSLFDPCVIKDNNGSYKMYVSNRKNGSIVLYESTDGINWNNDIFKTVLNKDLNSGWEDIVNRASVIFKDGKYYMWYTGQIKGQSKIGYAVSDDGVNFKRSENPIIVPEKEYEKENVMNPYVLYDEQENIYKMWYSAGEQFEPDIICYATSQDGISWEKYKKPVFKANEDNKALDSYKVGGCEVKKISQNEYIMFYIGYEDIITARIFVAKSEDGISNWKRSKNPLISMSEDKFDSEACYKPSAIFENGKWMIWYNGRTARNEYIGFAIYNKPSFNI